jgi:ABC-2 type transport system ATP-binding protein
MLALELVAVSKRYGPRRALRGVSLSLPVGSALGLLGPNGAGKTTTLRLLLGFARPSEGTVRLRGLPPSDPASRTGIAYLPERLALPGRMSVRAFLRFHGTLAGLADSDLDREVDAVLEETGIAERAHDRIADLSKGLAQRVAFAQALLARPEVLLLDEPTSGLDPIGVRDARGWIQRARARGCTVLVSSHILSEVERTCDRIAIMHEGQIAASGALDDLVRPGENLEDAFVRVVRG